VSVTGIVFRDDGRVLAIQRDDDLTWVPPGGVLELDESPTDGVAREVLEETGLHVQAERLTGVYKNMKLGMVNLVFRCTLLGGHPHPTDEARQVAWLSMDEVMREMPEARLVRITDALPTNGNGSPPARIHDGVRLI
jgi:ADP-ribose pyrophosphatase YjhB (NUDIX family)